nr:hypothetical protein [Tanacetum cinerariifolium]
SGPLDEWEQTPLIESRVQQMTELNWFATSASALFSLSLETS